MLTNEQITFLDQFCEKKGVRYYDLRMEIVDHLATEIEAEMQQQADTGFPLLVQRVFESFGENGFRSIVAAKTESTQDAYTRSHRSYFWSFFTPPKIILTLLIAGLLFLPFIYSSEKAVLYLFRVYVSFTAFICLLTVSAILIQPGGSKMPLLLLSGVKQKSLLRNIGLLAALLINGYNLLRRDHFIFVNPRFAGGVIVFSTMPYVFIFIARYQAVLKMYAKARREYPLAFMKNNS
ncbi:hypothetical protein LQ567_15635 [Niabella pedocola]|uniref:Uncharacterized protein n=1 Tax=Niabella pedocola TaxID=1752077 RepID=A0ABS8PT27_9BACT|nr:hypothetical protein [Niabella pedocola]MCD2424212.1 hypothetical protein [Niabella pedocola]